MDSELVSHSMVFNSSHGRDNHAARRLTLAIEDVEHDHSIEHQGANTHGAYRDTNHLRRLDEIHRAAV